VRPRSPRATPPVAIRRTTDMDHFTDATLIDSWYRNAEAWGAAVRGARIPSRVRVTDGAIVDAVLSSRPRTVLDAGCGEGWLCRALAARGIRATGIDAVPGLIEQARQGGGEFHCLSYEDLAAGGLPGRFDAMACNFSLLGKESVETLLSAARARLQPNGVLVVQTLHPVVACGDRTYRDGWRDGSWDGCGGGFAEPPPWYFRTLGSWSRLFVEAGFALLAIREPLDPDTGKPASVIFLGRPAAAGR
jgi:2-polyprenyl-3-methyl-5-hydroxy-6-metoxy-1,4-benzoquinol methylase